MSDGLYFLFHYKFLALCTMMSFSAVVLFNFLTKICPFEVMGAFGQIIWVSWFTKHTENCEVQEYFLEQGIMGLALVPNDFRSDWL